MLRCLPWFRAALWSLDRRVRWVLVLGYMGILYVLSALPGSATGPDTPLMRLISNALHFPLFAGLGGVCMLALHGYGRWDALAALGLTASYALFDEWHQSWVPGRSGSLEDVLLDLLGGGIGVLGMQRFLVHAEPDPREPTP